MSDAETTTDTPSYTDIRELRDSLDYRAINILRAVYENDGQADTSEIRKRTGFPNSKVRYRRKKLADHGLITVGEADGEHPGNPPALFELTERGEQAINRGLLETGGLPDPTDVEAVAERCHELSKRLDALREDFQEHGAAASERFAAIEREIEESKERLAELEDTRSIL